MKYRTVLLDLAGTLHDGPSALPGALDAVQRLRRASVRICAVSNTSRKTRLDLLVALQAAGFDFSVQEILTAPLAARRWLEAHGHRPFLLVHENLRPEFDGLPMANPTAVLVGDAADGFDYQALNHAFRLLVEGAPLLATGINRYFREGAALSLDAGPFVRALEFASGQSALVLGKPSKEFFHLALPDGDSGGTVMIGDDAENDITGAMRAGLDAILVRTGKYRAGDEQVAVGARCVADISAAVDIILDN